MALRTVYLDFTVLLSDREDVQHGQTEFVNGYMVSPDHAAQFWGASIQFMGQPLHPPAIISTHFIFQNNNYPRNVAVFSRKSGGWFGISWLFGDTTVYHWRGKFEYTPPIGESVVDGQPTQPVGIARRKWVEGFEIDFKAEGNGQPSNDQYNSHSRDSSRHGDGMGYAAREPLSTGYIRLIADISGTPASQASWERFYMRPRRRDGTAERFFWYAQANSTTILVLGITTTGAVTLYNVNGGVTPVLIGTYAGPLVLDQWYRFDIVFRTNTTDPVCKVYLNRALIFDATAGDLAGLKSSSNHTGSGVGVGIGSGTVDGLEIDFDDWICAEWPSSEASSGRYVGQDWVNGSKVHLIRATGFNPEQHGDWSGSTDDWRVLLQHTVGESFAAAAALSSSTALDAVVIDTDVVREVTALQGNIGIAAFNVCSLANGQACTFGYRLNGAALVTAARSPTTSGWRTMMYRPSGVITPDEVESLSLHFVKDNSGTTVRLAALLATVEVLGVFGQEDIAVEATTPEYNRNWRGIHNAPYPDSPWAREGSPAPAPVIAHGGIYTGNGTGQDLTFRIPVNWMWIRRFGDATVGFAHWWSSRRGGSVNVGESIINSVVVRAQIDPEFVGTGELEAQEQQTLVRIMGGSALINESGVTYQYIALCDPSMRYSQAGAFHHDSALSSAANALYKAGFVPLASFFTRESAVASTTDVLGYKGPGHDPAAGSILSTSETATYAEFAEGLITSKTPLHENYNSAAYSAWRLADGNDNAYVFVQIMSYVGNGAGARTIDLTPVSGRRPLWGLVVPHNGTSFYRDPSHSGSDSSQVSSGAVGTSGITGGGIDQIIVASGLNSNGVVYDVFVVPGGTLACNNGWSCNGEFIGEPGTAVDDDPTDVAPPPDDDDDDDDPDIDDPNIIVPPQEAPPEFAYEPENDRSRLIRLSNLCSRVLHRLGDSDQKIWDEDEIDSYILQAALEMATVTRLVWDRVYLENVPPGFSQTNAWEEGLLEHEFHYGTAAVTAEWELEEGDRAGLWHADGVTWGTHTSPGDLHNYDALGYAKMKGTAILPRTLVEIERSTWDERTMEALSTRDLIENDSRFQITEGEVLGYTWRQDGNRIYRKYRVPAEMAWLVEHDGGFGIARNVDAVSEDDGVTGTWGIPRRLSGWHPIGSTVGFGLPRRFYRDNLNVKVEHWRKFVARCKMSEAIDGILPRLAGEIPRRYFLYITDYCQWKALWRNGPGQNYKMGQLYKDRWERNLGRLRSRIVRTNKERLGRLGGNDPSPRSKPPRPRLPWAYGSKVR